MLTRYQLPALLLLASVASLLLHGPVHQFANYHDFADHSQLFGIPHSCDVLSNLPFLLAGLYGMRQCCRNSASHGQAGYFLFSFGLLLTAFGSSWYHLAPDDSRLLWDRLPIALSCAGLLAAVWADCRQRDSHQPAALLAIFAIASVIWWQQTADLRPYLLLQGLPLLLIPLWQWLYRRPARERISLGIAIGLYALAKVCELLDHPIAALLSPITGHTLKHLLAAAATLVVVHNLSHRQAAAQPVTCKPLASGQPVQPARSAGQ